MKIPPRVWRSGCIVPGTVKCKWCGCRVSAKEHSSIGECVEALEREVRERREALASRRIPRREAARKTKKPA